MLTQSEALIAAAAVSHLSRLGKSKEMVDEVAPERAPLKAIVMITSVHIKFFSFLVRLTASVTQTCGESSALVCFTSITRHSRA